MYSIQRDDRIVVKLEVPSIEVPDNLIEEIPLLHSAIYTTAVKSLYHTDGIHPAYEDMLTETIAYHLLDDELWDSESDEYIRLEAEKTLMAINFIESNRERITPFIGNLERIYVSLRKGLLELNNDIARVEFKPNLPFELNMEVIYERKFSG